MKPIHFKGCNIVYGATQPQYFPLPGNLDKKGRATFLWKLTWRERLAILFSGKMWHQVLTFGNPLQPQKLSVEPLLYDN